MELRHLRYLVAIAETGSLTFAAEKLLNTAQPSLGRQIRDLEQEVGVQLLDRSPHGTKLTAAGRAFLDHAGFRWLRPRRPWKQHGALPNPPDRLSRLVFSLDRRSIGCRTRRGSTR
jgi:hypothetical protein